MLESHLDLAFDLKTVEERDRIRVVLHPLAVVGHHLLDEVFGFLESFLTVDQHFTDVLAQVVADCAQDDVVLLIDEFWSAFLLVGLLDCLPELQQVVEVPLHLLGASTYPDGAHDDAHALGDVELTERISELISVVAFDAAGDAARPGVVGHQDEIPAGEADEGRQGSAFGAAFFLVDLDQDFLFFAHQILDDQLPAFGRLLLEILARNVFQGQKAMPVRTEVHEGGLQARLYAGDFGFVDACFLLLSSPALDVQVKEFLTIYEGNPNLFRLGRVYQHSFHLSHFLSAAGYALHRKLRERTMVMGGAPDQVAASLIAALMALCVAGRAQLRCLAICLICPACSKPVALRKGAAMPLLCRLSRLMFGGVRHALAWWLGIPFSISRQPHGPRSSRALV